MGKEYVLTQPSDGRMEKSAVKSILQAEYALLCIGDTLKHEFDEHARKSGIISIPSRHSSFTSIEFISSNSRTLFRVLFQL